MTHRCTLIALVVLFVVDLSICIVDYDPCDVLVTCGKASAAITQDVQPHGLLQVLLEAQCLPRFVGIHSHILYRAFVVW